MNVPYLGWSTTAQRFRDLVNDYSKLPVSVLFIGERGVGKRTMARIWRSCSGKTARQAPIVDLDREPNGFRQGCLAVSTSPTGSLRKRCPGRRRPSHVVETDPYHLDSGNIAPVPIEECDAAPIPDDLACQFDLRIYVPPLRRRLIDVLATVHFVGTQVITPRCESVTAPLVHRLMLDSMWCGNLAELLGYLRIEAARNGGFHGGDSAATDELPLYQRRIPNAVLGRPKHLRGPNYDWACEPHDKRDSMCVDIARLPQLAKTILLEQFFAEQIGDRSTDSNSEWNSEPQHPLGSIRRWTRKDKLRQSMPAGADALSLLTAYFYGLTPSQGFPAELVRAVETFQAFGGTLSSIESGMAASCGAVPQKLYEFKVESFPNRKPRRPRSLKPTADQEQAYDLVRKRGLTLQQAADMIGCTREAVRRRLKRYDERINATLETARRSKHGVQFIDNLHSNEVSR